MSNIRQLGAHIQGPTRCMRCKHEWQAVSPPGRVAEFECPACGCFTGVRLTMIEPEGERWQCTCECQLFYLDRKGAPMCANCGQRAKGWVDA